MPTMNRGERLLLITNSLSESDGEFILGIYDALISLEEKSVWKTKELMKLRKQIAKIKRDK